MFCWQLKDLGVIEGYENAIAPIAVGQERAERILDELLDSVEIPAAGIPDDFQIESHAFHISAAKGLIAASRYARHLVVGSRGLSGLDAAFPRFRLQADRQFRRLYRHRRALNIRNFGRYERSPLPPSWECGLLSYLQ